METFLNHLLNFLEITIVDGTGFYFDIASIFYLLAGMVLFFIISLFAVGLNRFRNLFIIIIFWETVQYIMSTIVKHPLFRQESLLNIMWDGILGMIGGFLMAIIILIYKLKKKKMN